MEQHRPLKSFNDELRGLVHWRGLHRDTIEEVEENKNNYPSIEHYNRDLSKAHAIINDYDAKIAEKQEEIYNYMKNKNIMPKSLGNIFRGTGKGKGKGKGKGISKSKQKNYKKKK